MPAGIENGDRVASGAADGAVGRNVRALTLRTAISQKSAATFSPVRLMLPKQLSTFVVPIASALISRRQLATTGSSRQMFGRQQDLGLGYAPTMNTVVQTSSQ